MLAISVNYFPNNQIFDFGLNAMLLRARLRRDFAFGAGTSIAANVAVRGAIVDPIFHLCRNSVESRCVCTYEALSDRGFA